jgi:hypothetical protein
MWTTVETTGDVCAVHVNGLLGPSGLQPCRAALDVAIAGHPSTVLVVLEHLGPVEPASVGLLGVMRRYLGAHGIRMVLAGAPAELREALRRHHLLDLYDLVPTVPRGTRT